MENYSQAVYPEEFLPGYSPCPTFDPVDLPTTLIPKPANLNHVHGMSTLINEYASEGVMLARGPQYLYQSIRDYTVITIPAKTKQIGPLGEFNEIVIACSGLHILWEDLGEVRSLAVHPSIKRRGLGKLLVDYLKIEARNLGIRHLFTFTLRPDFFKAVGFHIVPRETLPPIVWAGCSNCPKFYKCDEVGMMLHL